MFASACLTPHGLANIIRAHAAAAVEQPLAVALPSRVLKFALVGFTGVFINLGFLWLFTERMRMGEALSSTIAIELSIFWNFFLNNSFTFRDKNQGARVGIGARLFRYNLVSLLGMGIQLLTFLGLNALCSASCTAPRSDAGATRARASASAWRCPGTSPVTSFGPGGRPSPLSRRSGKPRRPADWSIVADARIVVLLPTYNEAGNLEPMLVAIRENLPAADVLVIDDNSPDGTGQMADAAAARDPHVKIAHRPGKQGLGVAYRFGYRWAVDQGYERVIQMDCDFSHDPKDLPRHGGPAGAAPGGRRQPPRAGRWLGRLALAPQPDLGAGSLYARTILASPIHDLTTGFKGFQAGTLKKLDIEGLRTDGFGFQIEVTSSLLALGIDVHEMPIRFSDRKVGKSKMSTKIFVEAMLKVWSIRSSTRRLRARQA